MVLLLSTLINIFGIIYSIVYLTLLSPYALIILHLSNNAHRPNERCFSLFSQVC